MSDEELASFGFTAADFDAENSVEIWPDNYTAVMAFVALGTQWRDGMNGATGLDYSAIPFVLRMRGVPRDEWPEVFEQIRIMEHEALIEMHKE